MWLDAACHEIVWLLCLRKWGSFGSDRWNLYFSYISDGREEQACYFGISLLFNCILTVNLFCRFFYTTLLVESVNLLTYLSN